MLNVLHRHSQVCNPGRTSWKLRPFTSSTFPFLKHQPYLLRKKDTAEATSANMQKNEALEKSIRETKAEYKRLGKSGLRVSVPILGAMSIGSKAWQDWVLEEDEVDSAFALPLVA